MQIVDTSLIKLDPKNYRRHNKKNKELIAKSLTECGAGRSVLIDKEGALIAGNGVYEQAKKLNIPTKIIETDGSELIVVQRKDLSTKDLKRKKLAVMDNSASDSSDFDLEVMKTDFTVEEIKSMGVQDPSLEIEQEKEIEEVSIPIATDPRTKPGDIWKLGKHRLMCGDSTSIDDVNKLMDGEKADMVFTDPPYGVKASGGRQQTKNKLGMKAIENDDLSGFELEKFLSDFISAMKYKTNASVYICYPWATQEEFTKAIKQNNLKIKNCIIWDKKVFGLNGFKGYRPQYEMIYFCCKEDFEWYGDKSQSNIWQISREIKREEQGNHPTPKPIELISKALVNSSKKQDCVYDAFGGSGSTLIACEQLNRKCYTMELDPAYCDVILTRWENLTGKKAVRLTGGKNGL